MKIPSALLFSATAMSFSHSATTTRRSSLVHMKPSATNESHGSSRRSFLTTGVAAALSIATGTIPASPAVASPSMGGTIVYGDESIMSPKAHGTSERPVQDDLMYGVSNKMADRICNFNRHFAEMGGYFQSTNWEDVVLQAKGEPIPFYDSVTGKPLFVAPIGRSAEDFIRESEMHGWPSFRDQEVVWDTVRVLRNSGETVSADGTHLGHNLPDREGNRYCINLVSIAGKQPALVVAEQ